LLVQSGGGSNSTQVKREGAGGIPIGEGEWARFEISVSRSITLSSCLEGELIVRWLTGVGTNLVFLLLTTGGRAAERCRRRGLIHKL
jgi:hypothetical protein